MKICALVPAYNEEKYIADVVARTRQQLEDVLVVDDGSSDNTVAIAEESGAILLKHEVNKGKGATLADGFDWAVDHGFDAVLALDADGQHLPEEIPLFLEAAEKFDIIVGNRMSERKSMPWVRWYTNVVMSGVVGWLARTRIPDSQCGFRLIRCDTWKKLNLETRNFDFESEMLVTAGRSGVRIGDVPISTVYGDEISDINPVTDTIRFLKMVWRLWRQKG